MYLETSFWFGRGGLVRYYWQTDCAKKQCFFYIVFTQAETPHMLRFVLWYSHISWPRSGDCGGSQIRTRDSCVICLVSPSCFNQLSHHMLNVESRYTKVRSGKQPGQPYSLDSAILFLPARPWTKYKCGEEVSSISMEWIDGKSGKDQLIRVDCQFPGPCLSILPLQPISSLLFISVSSILSPHKNKSFHRKQNILYREPDPSTQRYCKEHCS
jgi:hypothetical protein